ncbi:Polygalacturonase-2, partial [Datura stramonium]|nr:Polygalacturonase-2 [Datura stramonium]
MAIQNIIILLIVLSFVSISTCRSNNFHKGDDDDLFTQVDHNHNLEQEFGHDFQAYPSYLSTNNIEDQIHGFNNLEKVKNGVASIDVSSFGAKGDGNTDDTRAFEKAWKEACSSNTPVHFVVHHNKNYLLKHITFSGPCKSSILMQ